MIYEKTLYSLSCPYKPELAWGHFTGFAHGNAGIGWALIRLGAYANESKHITAGLQAFAYEATSALDMKNEEQLYQELQQMHTTFISVGYRSSLMKYHKLLLELQGDSTWQLLPTQKNQSLLVGSGD